jgi:hypothetical protein
LKAYGRGGHVPAVDVKAPAKTDARPEKVARPSINRRHGAAKGDIFLRKQRQCADALALVNWLHGD